MKADPLPTGPALKRLRALVGRVAATTGFGEVLSALGGGQGATLDGVRGSSCALVAVALAESCPGSLVVVLPHPSEVDDFLLDGALFSETLFAGAEQFPAWESLPAEHVVNDEVFGDRLRLVKRLALGADPPRIIVTSIQALVQPVPGRELLSRQTRRIAAGDAVDPNELARWLAERGFAPTGAVQLPGEFSLRGGILDMFAADWFEPVRIEWFGDQVESLRRFEVSTQRSLGPLDRVELTTLDPRFDETESLSDYLPPCSWVLLHEPRELEDEGRQYLDRLDRPGDFFTVRQTLERLYRFPSVAASALALTTFDTTCHLKIETVERFSGEIAKVRQELDSAGEGHEVYLVCRTEAELQRLREVFGETRLARAGNLHYVVGALRAGFRLVTERVVLVSGGELFHRDEVHRPSARRRLGRVIDSFLDLREGDYVVHIAHGIARYRGLRLMEKAGQTEEHLELEFEGGTKLYVPAARIELVQKYVGGTKARPKLAALGGRSWARQKESAERAVADLAAEMLELQAARASRPGIAFPADSDWQREFDASFPYVETPDQLAAIEAIRRDMRAARPMDRLLCGDVGYGKTEVAMRAAFKAVDAGYQVAVLVPTTVLAEQHGRTFRARMAEYPFTIEVLSRFCTAAEERRLLRGLADGSVDVVIGTHRLAQTDIQFHNLGLVIIDEEQRFGVQIKERLKAYRHIVDVLTMTATPIPRTLHMSLLGLRDISNLETPPADRLAVETRVTRFDPELIRHAIQRELGREGQVFFVHNRVHDILKVAWQLQQIVPEARIGIAHGQMPEGRLEDAMLGFVRREVDILLATTIIESGLDIPNANTIFIDNADQYGLAELHQLRGRVGRYKHRAYCYLLLDPNRSLTSTAARRLAAIEEFSDMGAGFAIAMRDLEIRGAGNILGTEQSGHISAVGYELYCELLDKTVRSLRNLPPKVQIDVNVDLPGDAYLPRFYVPDQRVKIDLYRRLNRVGTLDELRELRAEMLDRFGPLPPEAEQVVREMELRILAHRWGIDGVRLEERFLVLTYTDRSRIESLAARHPGGVRVVDHRSAYVPLPQGLRDPVALVELAKEVLSVEAARRYTPAHQ